MSNLRGTIKELVSQGVKVNGSAVDQTQLSMLTRVTGFATKVGTVPRPAGEKGKPANIWELNSAATLNVTTA